MADPLRTSPVQLDIIATDLQTAFNEKALLDQEQADCNRKLGRVRQNIAEKNVEIDRLRLELALASGIVKRDAKTTVRHSDRTLSEAELKAADDSIAETAKAFGLESPPPAHEDTPF